MLVANLVGALVTGVAYVGDVRTVNRGEILPVAPGENVVQLPVADYVVEDVVACRKSLARTDWNFVQTVGRKHIGDVGPGQSAGGPRIIGILHHLPFHAEPPVVLRLGLGPGISDLVREPIGVALVQLDLECVVIAGADTAVVIGGRAIWVQGSWLRIAWTRSESSVVFPADVGAVRAGADVVDSERQGAAQLALHTEVPLLGVRILDVRVVKPLVIDDRCGRREEPRARRPEGIL